MNNYTTQLHIVATEVLPTVILATPVESLPLYLALGIGSHLLLAGLWSVRSDWVQRVRSPSMPSSSILLITLFGLTWSTAPFTSCRYSYYAQL
jgi:hypothetical protein